MASPIPTLGHVVHYCLPWGAWRPAIVTGDGVAHEEGSLANLHVCLDGVNDTRNSEDVQALRNVGVLSGAVLSVASAPEGDGPGRWRWPVMVPARATTIADTATAGESSAFGPM